MKKFFLLISLIFIGFTCSYDFSGRVVKVYDWDTFRVQTYNLAEKIRVLGIDAPEIYHWQKIKSYKFYGCAQQSKNIAIKLLYGKKVKVLKDKIAKDRWKYWRKLRYVKFPIYYKGKLYYLDFWQVMVYLGWARVYKWENFKNKSLYYKLQNIAKKYKRWIWSKKCILEDEKIKRKYWKLAKKPIRVIYTKHYSNFENNISVSKKNCWYTYHKPGCDIKWNISRKWIKIYHLPWRRYYKRTIITPSKWERWFCSEFQAIKCWWRASYVR